MARALRISAALATLLALTLPASAPASGWEAVMDCTDEGRLDRSYSDRELREALEQLPTDQLEYGDCKQIIAAAIGDGSDGSGGKDGADDAGADAGVAPLDPAEQAAQQSDRDALVAATADAADAPIAVGDEQVRPGKPGLFDAASAGNGLPTPLLLVLIALGAAALATGGWLLRTRLPRLLTR
jgi:hypothetical protein